MAEREADGRREQLREREAEGDDEDEAMAGDENVSLQRAEGGGSSTGGIKKKRPRRRAHCLVNNGEMQKDRAWHARHENPAPLLRERESGYDCARAF